MTVPVAFRRQVDCVIQNSRSVPSATPSQSVPRNKVRRRRLIAGWLMASGLITCQVPPTMITYGTPSPSVPQTMTTKSGASCLSQAACIEASSTILVHYRIRSHCATLPQPVPQNMMSGACVISLAVCVTAYRIPTDHTTHIRVTPSQSVPQNMMTGSSGVPQAGSYSFISMTLAHSAPPQYDWRWWHQAR